MGRSANVATADCAPITKYLATIPISGLAIGKYVRRPSYAPISRRISAGVSRGG
jgi:hypothetical protein